MKTRTVTGCRLAAALTISLAGSSALGSEPGSLDCAFHAYAGRFLPIPTTTEELTEYADVHAGGHTGFVSVINSDVELIVSFNLSDPARPSFVDAIDLEGLTIFAANQNQLIAASSALFYSVVLYSVDDHGAFTSSLPIGFTGSEDPTEIVMMDDYALVANDVTVDVVEFAASGTVASFYPAGRVRAIDAQGSLAYVISRDSDRLAIFDFLGSDFPPVIGESPIAVPSNQRGRTRIAVNGDRAVITWRTGFEVFDISDPASPVSGGAVQFADLLDGYQYEEGGDVNVEMAGEEAFFSIENAGVCRVNVSDPAAPVLTGQQFAPGAAYKLALSDHAVILAELIGGVSLFDTAQMDIIDPVLGSAPAFPLDRDYGRRVLSVEDGIAYLGVDDYGMFIFDVDEPHNPQELGTYAVESEDVLSIEASGGYVYIATYEGGLEIVDATDPAAPTLVERLSPFDSVVKVLRSGETIAVLSDNDSAALYDISDPGSPALLGVVEDLGILNEHAVAFHNDVLYVSTRSSALGDQSMLRVVEVSDPSSPVSWNILTEDRLHRIAISGGRFYGVSEYERGVLYTSPLNDLARFDTFETYIESDTLSVDEGIVYLTDYSGRVHAVTDAARAPRLSGVVGTGALVRDTRVGDGVVFAANEYGLVAIDASNQCAPCIGDYDQNGTLNVFDFAAYIDAFNSGSTDADLDQNGTLNFIDIATFTTAYTDGCP